MTIQEIISRIKAEVERRMNGNPHYVTYKELESILSFLSDIEKSEKPSEGFDGEFSKFSNDVDAEHPFPICVDEFKDFARHFYELGRQSKPRIVFSKEVFDQYDREQFINAYKPKVCEGLEEEIERWFEEIDKYTPFNFTDIGNTARHFAKWGAVHIRKVTKNVGCGSEIPKDLESYAQMVENYYDVGEERGYLCTHRGDIKNAVLAGAKWQKAQSDKELSEKIAAAYQLGLADKEKQMMKEAVEGRVFVGTYVSSIEITAPLIPFDYNGTKVKLIIIKED